MHEPHPSPSPDDAHDRPDDDHREDEPVRADQPETAAGAARHTPVAAPDEGQGDGEQPLARDTRRGQPSQTPRELADRVPADQAPVRTAWDALAKLPSHDAQVELVTLLMQLEPTLRRVQRRVVPRLDFEEVQNEYYLKLLRSPAFARAASDHRANNGYLVTAFERVCLSLLRKGKSKASSMTSLDACNLDPVGGDSPTAVLMAAEEAQQNSETAARLLARLSATDRLILQMWTEKLTSDEICAALELRSAGAVRMRICRIRKRLLASPA